MEIYQCFPFFAARIGYWENTECETESCLKVKFEQLLSSEAWDAAEAWLSGNLVCRWARLPNGAARTAKPSLVRARTQRVSDLTAYLARQAE